MQNLVNAIEQVPAGNLADRGREVEISVQLELNVQYIVNLGRVLDNFSHDVTDEALAVINRLKQRIHNFLEDHRSYQNFMRRIAGDEPIPGYDLTVRPAEAA